MNRRMLQAASIRPKHSHAGMIRDKLGDSAGAASYLSRALDTNPHFPLLYVDVAKDTLHQIEPARHQ